MIPEIFITYVGFDDKLDDKIRKGMASINAECWAEGYNCKNHKRDFTFHLNG